VKSSDSLELENEASISFLLTNPGTGYGPVHALVLRAMPWLHTGEGRGCVHLRMVALEQLGFVIGAAIGTVIMAYHSAQGPQLGIRR